MTPDGVPTTFMGLTKSGLNSYLNSKNSGGSDSLDNAANIGDWINISLIAPSLGLNPDLKNKPKYQPPRFNPAYEIKVNNAMKTASKYLDGAGKVLGVVSYLDHANKGWQSMQNGNVWENIHRYNFLPKITFVFYFIISHLIEKFFVLKEKPSIVFQKKRKKIPFQHIHIKLMLSHRIQGFLTFSPEHTIIPPGHKITLIRFPGDHWYNYAH